jgi:hypothetical protein
MGSPLGAVTRITDSTADATAGAAKRRATSTVPRSLGTLSNALAHAISAPEARAAAACSSSIRSMNSGSLVVGRGWVVERARGLSS